MAFGSNFVTLAYNLINKYGTTLVYIGSNVGEYDPSSGGLATGEPTKQTIKGLPEEYADSIRFLGVKFETGSNIAEGDKKLTIAAYGLNNVPTVNDSVEQLGETFSIIGVAKAIAGEFIVYYVLHLRKT